MISASGISKTRMARVGLRYSVRMYTPRRSWQSVMIAPMFSAGIRKLMRANGSRNSSIWPASGIFCGLSMTSVSPLRLRIS